MHKFTNKRWAAADKFLLLIFYLFLKTAIAQTNNLLLNGSLSKYKIDSLQLKDNYYLHNSVQTEIESWQHNVCRQFYEPAYSKTGEVFLRIVLYQRVGYHDFHIENISGALCRNLVAGKKYRVSFYVKPYTGNAYASGVCVSMLDTMPSTSFYFEDAKKKDKGKVKPYQPINYINKLPINNRDSFYLIEFMYTALGHERYIAIGNFNQGKPKGWKPAAIYGNIKKNFDYAEWCMYAVSNLSVEPLDKTEGSCMETELLTSVPDTIPIATIYYATDSFQINIPFDSLISICNEHPDYTLLVIGHTDNEGSATYNQTLSEKRAKAVADALTGRVKNAMHYFGAGDRFPLENKSPSLLNRRVDIKLVR